MTEYISRNYGNKSYEVIIKTESKEHYKAAEEFARRLVGHEKLTNNGVVVREDGCEVCRRHVPPGANYCWKCGRPLR